MSWIDNALGIHPAALALSSRRTEILAANIANSDTPGFKAKDINFQDVLSQHESNFDLKLRTTNGGHSNASDGSLSSSLLYRVPTKASSDGNTVQPEVEQAAFAENAVRYQTSIQFLDGAISGLRLAIKGQ